VRKQIGGRHRVGRMLELGVARSTDRGELRLETPAGIRSITARGSGPRSAKHS
jgi:hypothetical protein